MLAKKLSGALSVTPAETDANFKQTVLLLHGDGTNGAQNNTFTDSSTNNFTITRNGNTTQGTFSPFSQTGWSNYFDGTGDYITVGYTSAFAPNTYVSLECWVLFDSLASDTLIVGRQGMWLNYSYTSIGTTSNKIAFSIYDGSNWYAASSSTTPSVGQWYHIVGVRDNTTLRIYVNGVQEGTAAFSGSPAAYSTNFAMGGSHTGSNYVTGYISNVRYCNGSTSGALPYTGSSFTVPTSALTSTGSTVLLTCQSNRFKDNSSNAFAITVNGNPSVQAFSPFAPSAAYSTSTNGGSGYFDENGDYLDCGNGGTDYEFGSGDFTIEGWFYCLGKSQRHQMIMAKGSPTTNNAYDWRLYWGDTSNQRIWFDSNVFSVSSDTTTAEDLVLNAWNHIAVVRSGANGYLYLNGTRIDSVAAAGTMNNSYTNVYVGAGNVGSAGQTYYNGYANGIRLLKGTAQYTGSTYTVPTSPFTAITNTELLLNFTGAAIFDQTGKNNLETVGNAQIDTGTKKFGTGSLEFDGNGDWLLSNAKPMYDMGNGDFTVEFWVNSTTSASGSCIVGVTQGGGGTNTQWGIFQGYASSTSVDVYLSNGSSYFANTGGGNVTDGNWHHVAFSRSGSSGKLFVDGTQVGSTLSLSTTALGPTNLPLYVGSQGGSYAFTGFIDDLRITKSVARYTANFTAPTKAFPDL